MRRLAGIGRTPELQRSGNQPQDRRGAVTELYECEGSCGVTCRQIEQLGGRRRYTSDVSLSPELTGLHEGGQGKFHLLGRGDTRRLPGDGAERLRESAVASSSGVALPANPAPARSTSSLTVSATTLESRRRSRWRN